MAVTGTHQRRLLKLYPSLTKFPGSGTEIIPGNGKHSDTRIKIYNFPLVLLVDYPILIYPLGV